jgi:hypothetical protein
MYVHMIWLLSFVGLGGPSELTNAVDCEIHLRSLAKMHFVSNNNDLRTNLVNMSRMNIPLCHMQPMPMVYPIKDVDVDILE